jgi:hypothetical protein
MALESFLINSIDPGSNGRFYAQLDTDKGKYWYVPKEFVYQGLRQGENQFFDQSFLNKEYLDKLKPIRLDDTAIPAELKNAGYRDPSLGFLISDSDFNKYDSNGNLVYYYEAKGKFAGAAKGIAEKDGELVYSLEGAGGSNYGYFDKNGVPWETTVNRKTKFGIIGDLARGFTELVAGVPFLPEVAGFATGNPQIYASLKAAQKAGQGGDLEDVIKAGGTALATATIMKNITTPSGGVYGGDVDVQPGGFYGEVPGGAVGPGPGAEVFPVTPPAEITTTPIGTPSAPPVDYSLIGGANFPPATEGMGGGTGITPGAAGTGLQQPTMPNIAGMGGGQGLTVSVDGGTVGQLGFTPIGATPVLGDPKSFINNPDVLGQPVLTQGSPAPLLSLSDALRGARLASSLLGGGATTQIPETGAGVGQPSATGIDYSALLGLLSQRAGATGLLGTRFAPQPVNLSSLLG